VPWAIVPLDPGYADRCVKLGCKCLSIGFDNLTLHAGLRD